MYMYNSIYIYVYIYACYPKKTKRYLTFFAMMSIGGIHTISEECCMPIWGKSQRDYNLILVTTRTTSYTTSEVIPQDQYFDILGLHKKSLMLPKKYQIPKISNLILPTAPNQIQQNIPIKFSYPKLMKSPLQFLAFGSVSKPYPPVVHIKIADKWLFIPLKMVCKGIDPQPFLVFCSQPTAEKHGWRWKAPQRLPSAPRAPRRAARRTRSRRGRRGHRCCSHSPAGSPEEGLKASINCGYFWEIWFFIRVSNLL